LSTILLLAGFAAIVAGCALISESLALIVGGFIIGVAGVGLARTEAEA